MLQLVPYVPSAPVEPADYLAALMSGLCLEPTAEPWADTGLEEPTPFAGMDHLDEIVGQVSSEGQQLQQLVSTIMTGCMLAFGAVCPFQLYSDHKLRLHHDL